MPHFAAPYFPRRATDAQSVHVAFRAVAEHSLSGRTLGGFIVGDLVPDGRGGHGSVYSADQPGLGREVVVKVLQGHDVAARRFRREAVLAARVGHPGAAHIYDAGVETDGTLWIAMERVHGITLTRWLRERGPMPLDQFVPFFELVAQVVQAAHRLGIVHRDLKPSNIMIEERDGELWARLLDFGVAKLIGEAAGDDTITMEDMDSDTPQMRPAVVAPRTRGHRGLTMSGMAIGTPAYMAPEQWDNQAAVGAAADIYALGIVAFEALTGRRPFQAPTPEELCHLHRYAAPPALGEGFSPALDRVLRRALAKRPEDRWGSALDFARALRREVETQRRERRERWLRGALVGLGMALAATGVGLARARASAAEQVVVRSESEQGRSALLHGELAAAQRHLSAAWQLGDRSSELVFMLARASQPRAAELAQLAPVSGRSWSAAFSPDRKRMIASDDGGTRIWDATTYRPLATMPHGDTVYQAIYSADGSQVITACGDGAVRTWDADGTLLRELRSSDGRAWRYTMVATSGRLVAAIERAGSVAIVWDASGAELARLANDGAGSGSIVWSQDGRWLATSGGDDVRVFDTQTWAEVLRFKATRVRSLAFDPTGPRLAVGTSGGDASIWEMPSGRRVHHLREVGESVDVIAWAARGDLIATASRDGGVQMWRAGELQAQLALTGRIYSLDVNPSSTAVAASTGDGSVVIADTQSGVPIAAFTGGGKLAQSVHFDADGRRVVAASWDGKVRVWSTAPTYRRSAAQHAAVSLSPERRVEVRSPDGHLTVIIPAGDGAPEIWDASGRMIARLIGHVGRAWSARFVAGGRVLTAGSDGTARLWDAATGELRQTFESVGARASRFLADAALSNEGAVVVAGAGDGTVRFFDAATGRQIWLLQAHRSPVVDVHFDDDGQLVTHGQDGDGARWELPDPAAVIRDTVVAP